MRDQIIALPYVRRYFIVKIFKIYELRRPTSVFNCKKFFLTPRICVHDQNKWFYLLVKRETMSNIVNSWINIQL